MKAYEFPAKVSAKGELELPEETSALLPRDQAVRVIILIPESDDFEEQIAWSHLTAEQFLAAGYHEADAVYDNL